MTAFYCLTLTNGYYYTTIVTRVFGVLRMSRKCYSLGSDTNSLYENRIRIIHLDCPTTVVARADLYTVLIDVNHRSTRPFYHLKRTTRRVFNGSWRDGFNFFCFSHAINKTRVQLKTRSCVFIILYLTANRVV